MNGSFTTINSRGDRETTPLWITFFQTDLQLEMQSAQLKRGMSHRPIRLQERYLEFGVTWVAQRENERREFHRKIREHQQWCLDNTVASMVFTYKPLRTFYGMIEAIPEGASRFVPTYNDTYRFRVWNRTRMASTARGVPSPLLPTESSVSNYGEGWYNLPWTPRTGRRGLQE